jgi:hypothetical protein
MKMNHKIERRNHYQEQEERETLTLKQEIERMQHNIKREDQTDTIA